MIYIDPPYNTGNDFIYEDDFADDTESYKLRSNQTDEDGNRLIANTESNGRFHSDWLSMMYSRLRLARNLLRNDGCVFISIDDNEQANLKRLCDEVFGEENFIDTVIWKKRYGGGAKEKYLVSLHEYALIYARNEASLESIYIPLTEESIKRYYTQKDENFSRRGAYRTHPLEATKSMGERQNLVFDIPAPDGSTISPKRQWLWSKDRVSEAIANNEIEFIKDRNGGWSVHSKQYLKDELGNVREGKAFSIIDDIYTQHGTNEIIDLLGNAQTFSFPKPTAFIRKLLQIGLNGSKEDIVLDFFSGSATTAHAVMQLNAEDGGNRKYIMVQLPETCDEKSEAKKAGFATIAEIGKERIRRAGQKIKTEKTPDLDIGFRVLKIDSSNMNEVYYSPDQTNQKDIFNLVDNIRHDRNDEDLLFQVLLDWGVDLTLPITQKTIDKKTVFLVANNEIVACFDRQGGITENFIKELSKQKPLRVVFCDSGFADDSVKINIEQVFKSLSPQTEIKTI
jgi:adenine-specific DNA-methyltransferase